MSLQTSKNLPTFEPIQKPIKLSEIISKSHMSNGDSLSTNFSEATVIDTLPDFYLKVTKLSLSHNKLSSLTNISQFSQLTHLNISYNRLQSPQELLKVPHRENLLVLSIEGNPCSRHPDLIPIILTICPRLVDIDGFKISDHTRQDISDGVQLSKKLIPYLCKNQSILDGLDRDVKRIKLELELLQDCKLKITQETGPYWEDINARHDRWLKTTIKIPKLPNFAYHSKIRPYMLIDYIEIVGKSLHYFMSDETDDSSAQRLYKWMFCEVLLSLHSWGMHGVQLFLQEHTGTGNLDQCFQEEIEYFRTLCSTEEDSQQYSDIFPNAGTNMDLRGRSFERIFEKNTQVKENEWKVFPVFSCDGNYIKAILSVLQMQIKQIEELDREKQELLSFDTSCLGIPGFVDRNTEGLGVSPVDFVQDHYRASSRTTVKQGGSPNLLGISPREVEEQDFKKNRPPSTVINAGSTDFLGTSPRDSEEQELDQNSVVISVAKEESQNLFGVSPRDMEKQELNKNILVSSPENENDNKESLEASAISREESLKELKIEKEHMKKIEDEQRFRDELEERIREAVKLEKKALEIEKDKILEEKITISQKLKDLEEKGVRKREKKKERERESQELENRKTTKMHNEIQDKNSKLIVSGIGYLSNFLKKNKVLPAFHGLKEYSANLAKDLSKESSNLQFAENYRNKKIKSLVFLALRYAHIIAKTKRIRADNFYLGRLLLDSFFAWKNNHATKKSKGESNKQRGKSVKKIKDIDIDAALKTDFENLLKRLTNSEKHIKKLWKILRKKKNCIKRECLCGGFKCQSCIKEKTNFIKKELIYIKKKLVENKSRKGLQ